MERLMKVLPATKITTQDGETPTHRQKTVVYTIKQLQDNKLSNK